MKQKLKRIYYLSIPLIFGLCFSYFLCQNQYIKSLERALTVYEESSQYDMELLSELTDFLQFLQKYKIPIDYLSTVLRECKRHNLDAEFMIKLMYVESNYDPKARSNKGAYGLMQLQYPTAKDVDSTLVSYWQLFEPERNIVVGVKYFKQLLDYYGGDYKKAAIAYNRGIGRVDEELAEGKLVDWYYNMIIGIGVVE